MNNPNFMGFFDPPGGVPIGSGSFGEPGFAGGPGLTPSGSFMDLINSPSNSILPSGHQQVPLYHNAYNPAPFGMENSAARLQQIVSRQAGLRSGFSLPGQSLQDPSMMFNMHMASTRMRSPKQPLGSDFSRYGVPANWPRMPYSGMSGHAMPQLQSLMGFMRGVPVDRMQMSPSMHSVTNNQPQNVLQRFPKMPVLDEAPMRGHVPSMLDQNAANFSSQQYYNAMFSPDTPPSPSSALTQAQQSPALKQSLSNNGAHQQQQQQQQQEIGMNSESLNLPMSFPSPRRPSSQSSSFGSSFMSSFSSELSNIPLAVPQSPKLTHFGPSRAVPGGPFEPLSQNNPLQSMASMSPPYGPSTPNPIARVSPSICANLNSSLPLSPASLQNQQTQLRPDLSPPKYQLLWAQMQQMQYQLGQLKQQPQSPQVITQMELLNQGYQQLCKQYSAARQQSMVHVQKRDDIGAASDGPIHYQQQSVQSQPGQLLMAQPSPKPMLQPSPKLINQPSPKHLPMASPKQTSVLSVPPSPQQQVTDTQPGHPLQQMSNAHPAAPVPMSRQSEQKSQPLHGLGIMTQQMNFAPPSFLQTPQQLSQLQAPQSAHNYLGASAPGVQAASQQVFSSLDPQSMQMLGHQQMQNLNRPRLMLVHEANMPVASSSRSTSLPLNLSDQQLLTMTLSSQHSQMQQSVFQQSMLVSSVATSLASSRQQQQNDLSSQDLLHASLIDDTLTIPDLDDLDSKPGESFLNDDSKTDSLFPNAFLGSSDFFGSSNLFAGDSSHDFLGESKAGVKLDSTVHVQKQDEFNPFASLPLNIYGNSLFSTATGTAVMTLPAAATSGSIAGLRPSLLPGIATGIKSKPAKAKSKAVPKGTGKASSKNAGKSAGKGSEKCEKGAGVKTKSASSGGAKKKKGKKLEVEVTPEEENADVHEEQYLIANEEKAADSLLDSAMRRSLRERTSKKNYKDDFDYNLSDDEDKNKIEKDENSSTHGQAVLPKQIDAVIPGGANQFIAYKPSEEVEGEIACIEKILAMRSRQQNELDGDPTLMIEEYFVKYKGYSYLHCEWLDLESLTKKDRRAPSKVKRYQQKRDTSLAFLNELDDEPFNPDYLEIDRVLDTTTIADPGTGEVVNHYLVKWRALPYEESTWELEMNLDPALIEKYHQLKRLPPPDQIAIVSRPPPDHWKRFEQSPIYKGGNTLREYQLEGLNWLTFCWYKRQNCILADEMGLGKTIQSIALLCAIKNHGIRGPFLVIAPLSTIANWQREFEAWTDINAIVYHGSLQSRAHIQQYELHFKGDNGAIIPGIYKFEAIITTYEMVLSANSFLSTIPFRCLIIDEAHRLKNQKCKLVENLSNLQWEFCVLLTGTPLQNNVEELFSLLNFLDPSKFSSLAAFLIEFGDLKTESQVENLQRILKPMMLRRLKEDVEKNIAPKEETIIEVELTMIQKKFYRAILERNFSFLSKGGGNANLPSLMNTMMELRKCCNHPFLINGAEEKIVAEYVAAVDEPFRGQKRTLAMIESSGKMVLIDKLLPKLKEGGHKVLIFSQMIRVLNLIEDYLIGKRYLFERIDGSIRGDLRQAAIDRFCRPDSDRFVFLLCTRAGGLGINLTAADTVIIFDSDWNPQNDLQAQARCHRIGQEKAVKVYRLVCKNTYEREMFDRASLKLGLDKAVLQNMNNKDSGSLTGQAMSKKEVEELLKKGAYGAIMETDDDSSKFCEEDIDLILERRTQVIKIDSGQKGSTFAKASFVSDKAQMDIDLDDPDFWQKWAKKASVDVEQLEQNELIVDQPRKRKQTKRFGNVDEAVELSDLESDEDGNSSDRDLMSRQPRPKGPIERTAWTRVECFKVEKNLLVFGWGRWVELREHAHFRQHIQNTDIEAIARTILAFCFRHYRTDERTKQFFVELISESAESAPKKVDEFDITSQILSSAPSRSARGRKRGSSGRNALRRLTHQYSKPALVECGVNWLTVDPETMIIDPGYRKHLQHHCNKIMARVRLLYCLKNDVIKESSDDILSGKNASDVAFVVPAADSDLPADWWDENADKSLVMGVYKHGYEKYREIRIDPCLYFFHKLGPLSASEKQAASPDSAANPASIERLADDSSDLDFMTTAGRRSKGRGKDHDEDSPNDSEEEKDTMSSTGSPASVTSHKEPAGKHLAGTSDRHWPLASDMNTRLRRIVAAYMKSCEKEFLDTMKAEKDKQKQERIAMQVQARQRKKIEMQQRWTRREEADFYRAVSTFGVVYDTKVAKYNWDKFRQVAKLDKKQDDSLTAYYEAFMAMCRRVAGRPTEDDIRYQRGHSVDGISDERASRCLHRVELLRKIREKVLPHGKLDERLKLSQLSVEFPPWWEVVKHDKALLEGVAKHGLGRTEYHLFVDPDLPFKEILDTATAKMKKDPVSGKKEEAIVESAKGEALEARRMENGEHSDSDSLLPSEKGFVGSPVAARKFAYPADTEDSDNRLTLNLPEEMAHILSSWPKDRAIMGHLEKLCHCVLEGEWPRAARYDILPPAKMAVVGRAPVHSVGLHSHSERAPGGISVRGDEAAAGRHGSRDFKIKSIDGLKLTVKSETKKRKRPEEDEVLHGSPPDARGEQGRYHYRNTDDASTNASVPYVVESLRDDNHGLRQKSRKKMLEGQEFPLYGGSRHERVEKGQPSRPHVQIHIPKSNKVAVVTPPHSHTRRSPRPVLHYPIHRHPSVEDLSPSIERRQLEPRSGIKVDSDKAEDRGVGDTLGIRTRRNSRVIPESDAGDASAQDMDSMYTIANAAGVNSDLNRRGPRMNMKEKVGSKESTTQIVLKIPDPSKYFHSKESTKRCLDSGHELLSPVDEKAVRESRLKEEYDRRLHRHESPPPVMACKSPAETTSLLGFSASSKEVVSTSSPERDSKSANGRAPQRLSQSPHSRSARAKRAGVPSPVHMIPAREFYYAERYQDRSLPASSPYMHRSHSPASPLSHVQHRPLSPRIKHRSPPLYRGRGSVSPQRRPRSRSPPRIYEHGEHIRAHRYVAPPVSPRHRGASSHVRSRSPYMMEHHAAGHISPHSHSQEGRSFPHHSSSAAACNRVSPIIHADADRAQNLYHRGLSPPVHGQLKVEKYGFVRPSERSSSPTRHGIDRFSHDRRSPHVIEERFPYGHAIDWEHARGGSSPRNPVAAERRSPRERSPPAGRFSPFRLLTFQQEVKETGSSPSLPGSVNVRPSLVQKSKSVSSSARPPRNEATALGKNDRSGHLPTIADPPLLKNEREQSLLHSDSPPKLSTPPKLERPVSLKSDSLSSACPGALERPPLKFYEPARFESASEAIEAAGHDTQENSHARESTSKLPRSVIEIPEPSAVPLPTSDGKVTKKRKGALEAKIQGLKDRIQQKPGGLEASIAKIKSHRLDFISKSLQVSADQGRGATPGLSSTCLESDRISSRSSVSDQHVPASSTSTRLSLDTTADARCLASDDVKAADGRENSVICMKFASGPSACPVDPSNSPRPDSTCPGVPENVTVEDRVSADIQNAS